MNVADIHMRDLMATTTLTFRVRGVRSLRFRLWLGAHLAHLTAWVMGMKVEISMVPEDDLAS